MARNDLASSIRKGDSGALARGISLVEGDPLEGGKVLNELADDVGKALRIGVTGPPGVGKSTLIDALTELWTKAGRRVGILAVDPTSPFTGGALLGDRVRMGRAAEAGAIFIRSMATRGAAGGLARAAADAMDLIDAFGADVVFVETVGAGQGEIDVARASDVTLVLVSPESGDGIQAMKSGIMEIADLLVVNKADRPGADRIEVEIRSAFELSTTGRRDVPILRTEAYQAKGVPELAAAIDAQVTSRRASGAFEARRRENARLRIQRIAEEIVRQRLWQNGCDLEPAARDVVSGKLSSYAAAAALVKKFFNGAS